MNNKSSSPNTNKQNKNDKSQKQSTNRHMTSNGEHKGSKDEIQLHNKFESLSDESDMEFVDSIDHPRAGVVNHGIQSSLHSFQSYQFSPISKQSWILKLK